MRLIPYILGIVGLIVLAFWAWGSRGELKDKTGFSLLPFSHGSLRMQQIDRSLRGEATSISRLTFRADGEQGIPVTSKPRKFYLEVWMAASELSGVTREFRGNSLGEPKRVFAGDFEFPGWRSGVGDRAKRVTIDLNEAYEVDPQHDLLIELRVTDRAAPKETRLVVSDYDMRGTGLVMSGKPKPPGCKPIQASMQGTPAGVRFEAIVTGARAGQQMFGHYGPVSDGDPPPCLWFDLGISFPIGSVFGDGTLAGSATLPAGVGTDGIVVQVTESERAPDAVRTPRLAFSAIPTTQAKAKTLYAFDMTATTATHERPGLLNIQYQ